MSESRPDFAAIDTWFADRGTAGDSMSHHADAPPQTPVLPPWLREMVQLSVRAEVSTRLNELQSLVDRRISELRTEFQAAMQPVCRDGRSPPGRLNGMQDQAAGTAARKEAGSGAAEPGCTNGADLLQVEIDRLMAF
jgi:hypothetical protein